LQKEQKLLNDQHKEDGAKVRGGIEHLQEKVQKSYDSLGDRIAKFEKEVGEDLKVLKKQFQTRGDAQEQRAAELQQDLAKLAYDIQKEQTELTKLMQDSLEESIKRSQSELERKLAKHVEDIDCQMQEDFVAREESLTSLKDDLAETFQKDLQALHQEVKPLMEIKDRVAELQDLEQDLRNVQQDVRDLKDDVRVLFDQVAAHEART